MENLEVMFFLNGYFQAWKRPGGGGISNILEKSWKFVIFTCAFTLSFNE